MKEKDYIEKYGYSKRDAQNIRDAENSGLVGVEYDDAGCLCVWCHGLSGSIPPWALVVDETSNEVKFCRKCGKTLSGAKKVKFSDD